MLLLFKTNERTRYFKIIRGGGKTKTKAITVIAQFYRNSELKEKVLKRFIINIALLICFSRRRARIANTKVKSLAVQSSCGLIIPGYLFCLVPVNYSTSETDSTPKATSEDTIKIGETSSSNAAATVEPSVDPQA